LKIVGGIKPSIFNQRSECLGFRLLFRRGVLVQGTEINQQSLAQTGIMGSAGQFKHVAPGRATIENQQSKRGLDEMKKLMVVALTLMVMLFFGAISFAGSLDDTGSPTSTSSAMFTLEDIYDRLGTGAAGTKRPGAFVEPSSGPAPTGHTLDEVMGLAPTVDDTNGAIPAGVVSGKTFWGLKSGNWGLKTGTMTNHAAKSYTPGAGNQTISEGYYNGSGQVDGDAALVTGNIRSGVTIFGVAGDSNVVNTSSGDAAVGDILTGKKAWVDGSEVTGRLTCSDAPTGNAEVGNVLAGKTFSNSTGIGLTGNMPDRGAVTYTPTTASQAIAAGYHNGSGVVSGDADLSEGNIKAGTEIFTVTGTFPNDGTAATGDVKTGSTFYTNSAAKLTGTGTTTLSSANDTVSAGYYEATTLSAVDADLAPENIRKDVAIFGTVGTYEEGGGCSAPVAKTGQTESHATGDDGDLEKGVEWPNPRFTDNTNGTVTDNLTGLMWLKNAGAGGSKTWRAVLTYCNDLDLGGHTDWRLPNVKELQSLIDYGQYNPALSNTAGIGQWTEGNPFTDVQSGGYWSSTTYESITSLAWGVSLDSGSAGLGNKDDGHYVWPVRSNN
jgi:hypothetical protein